MPLQTGREFWLINKLKKQFLSLQKNILLGIGDDCAAIKPSPGHILLISTDSLVEGVHFDLNFTTPFHLGKKSLAINLSDIAAMGGKALYALVSIAIPPTLSSAYILKFYQGLKSLADKYNIAVIGGDTSSSTKHLFISITVIGEGGGKKIIRRSTAKAGEKIFVTGTLGDSGAGLDLLKSPPKKINSKIYRELTLKHLLPEPRLNEGAKLASQGFVSSMLDLSDGLAGGIKRICEESNVGAKIFLDKLPLSESLKNSGLKKSPIDYALYGGEDYELLFTAKKKQKINFTQIGEITNSDQGIQLIDANNQCHPLLNEGYVHL